MLKEDENKNDSNFLDKTFRIWLIACLSQGFAVYFVIPFPLSVLTSLGIIL